MLDPESLPELEEPELLDPESLPELEEPELLEPESLPELELPEEEPELPDPLLGVAFGVGFASSMVPTVTFLGNIL